MKKLVLVCSGLFFFLFAAFSSSFAVELTADTVTKEGGKARNGKIYVKESKCRIERAQTPIYYIVRGDKNLLWQVNGAEKMYVEAKLTPAMKPKIEEKLAGEVSRKQVGQETIDNHPAKKYEVVVKEGGKTETYYQWWATDVNFPVRIVAGNGKWTVDYKNIKKGNVADALFELPAGAQKDMVEVPDVLH